MKSIVLVILVAVAVLFSFLPFTVKAAEQESPHERFLHALRIVECGDVPDPPKGDKGKALGPYQIWRQYFKDAKQADRKLAPLQYSDCSMEEIGRLIVRAYMHRYAKSAWNSQDWKTLACTHNGGPKWNRNKSDEDKARLANALIYWSKVEATLKSLEKK